MIKLKQIAESFGHEEEIKQFSIQEKQEILEMISDYNSLGESLARHGSLPEIAERMGRIAEASKHIALSEGEKTGFNQKVIGEDMKILEKSSASFNKIAQEAHSLEQQLTALYEDIGYRLGRYFEIREPLSEITSVSDL